MKAECSRRRTGFCQNFCLEVGFSALSNVFSAPRTRTVKNARSIFESASAISGRSFVAAGRRAAAARLFETLRHIDADGSSASMPEETLAQPFCEALLAFGRGDYAGCIEWLTRVRNIAPRCGGSLAQCDLIHLTFTEAALRARKARLARSLVAERSARKPASRFNRLLQHRLEQCPAVG
jgi:hypothetical protein